MELSPEERKRIYEEEKARLEAQEKIEGEKPKATGSSTTNLKPHVAGLLCYVGFWVTGIIFLFIERRNKLVRFHAMQALVTFGILNIIWGTASSFGGPAGWRYVYGMGFYAPLWLAGTIVFGIFFAIWWILWGVAMYKTYHGTPYRVPLFSGLADKCLAKLDGEK